MMSVYDSNDISKKKNIMILKHVHKIKLYTIDAKLYTIKDCDNTVLIPIIQKIE